MTTGLTGAVFARVNQAMHVQPQSVPSGSAGEIRYVQSGGGSGGGGMVSQDFFLGFLVGSGAIGGIGVLREANRSAKTTQGTGDNR